MFAFDLYPPLVKLLKEHSIIIIIIVVYDIVVRSWLESCVGDVVVSIPHLGCTENGGNRI